MMSCSSLETLTPLVPLVVAIIGISIEQYSPRSEGAVESSDTPLWSSACGRR